MKKTNSKYGTSVAALVLADVVTEHVDSAKISRKVARMLNHFNIRANFIESSLHPFPVVDEATLSSVKVFYNLLVQDYIHRCDEVFYHSWDKQVRSFMKNVIKAKHKAWLDLWTKH